MSDSQEIQIEDLSSGKDYFTLIPNIIHYMGLGCYVVAYYSLLKSVAGDKSACFMSQKTISNILGCSKKQIQLMNEFMQKPFLALGGKPLIKVIKRKKENGEKDTNVIQILDIWPENVLGMQDRKSIPKTQMKQKKVKNKEIFSSEPSSLGSEPSSLGSEPGSHKEEPCKKNPLRRTKREQQQEDISPNGSVVVFLGKLEKIAITEKDKKAIASYAVKNNFSEEDLDRAIEFVTSPKFKVKTTLTKSIMWALNENPEPHEPPQSDPAVYTELKAHIEEIGAPINLWIDENSVYVGIEGHSSKDFERNSNTLTEDLTEFVLALCEYFKRDQSKT